MTNDLLRQVTGDHRYVLEVVARQAGFTSPVAVNLDDFYTPLVKMSRKGAILPIDGVLVRDWCPENRRLSPGLQLGMRFYEIERIQFVTVHFRFDEQRNYWAFNFVAVDRKDYMRLYKIALRCRRDFEPAGEPPILPPDLADLLWNNTIEYLEPKNLRRIKEYGGRARRGVLLIGSPGNGKTMACRWLWDECRRRHWEYRLVTPDSYREARNSYNAKEAVQELFRVDRQGIVFFDDMDLALRNRETVHETDDQAIFLSAMDGLTINEGVVHVFTTNCSLELIDQAFKRPGRLDLVLHFNAPTPLLRHRLMDRWHEDIRSHIDLETAVASTEGYSFAEIEELKNLLIMHFMDSQAWDWSLALKQFDINRNELANHKRRQVGFGLAEAVIATSGNGE
ncbi:MAG TPA: ATP-binding protein [Gemmataceae bacterium]|nr:ATP-binding protein [Gemmataceae bacterium]